MDEINSFFLALFWGLFSTGLSTMRNSLRAKSFSYLGS
jgi:hypothetical protein